VQNLKLNAIKCYLTKSVTAASPSDYSTNFTILYRASSTDPWVLATYDQVNGGGVSSVVGNLNTLNVSGGGAAESAFIFEFSTQGEYVVRNNGVRGVGCTGCTTCAEFKVEFYDATTYTYPAEGPPAAPCTDCVGAL